MAVEQGADHIDVITRYIQAKWRTANGKIE